MGDKPIQTAARPSFPGPGGRRALLARVHIARKEMGLGEDAYRALLLRVTGEESAGDATYAQLVKVLADMTRLGWKPKNATRRSEKPHVRKIWALWTSMKMLLADPSRVALQSFTARQTRSVQNPLGIADPDFLNVAEAKKVIHGLDGWRARLLVAKGAADGAQ